MWWKILLSAVSNYKKRQEIKTIRGKLKILGKTPSFAARLMYVYQQKDKCRQTKVRKSLARYVLSTIKKKIPS